MYPKCEVYIILRDNDLGHTTDELANKSTAATLGAGARTDSLM